MKNIETILTELGVTIPEDKKEAFQKAVAENYKTVAEFTKLSDKLEAQTEKAKTAEDALKTFEGIDPTKINDEIAGWKKKAEDAEKEYNDRLAKRDYEDALKAELDAVKFSSAYAKKAVTEAVRQAGLTCKNGKILGLSDLLDQMRQEDASAFVSEAEENKAQFTAPKGATKPMSRDDIMNIKNPAERQKAIAENISLFQ